MQGRRELKRISAGKEKQRCYGAVRSCSDAILRKDDQGLKRGIQRERGHSGQCGWAAGGASCHWRPE